MASQKIFNTGQGSQFTFIDFTIVLKKANIAISMDGKGSWWDNVFVERLWRSTKYEEVYLGLSGISCTGVLLNILIYALKQSAKRAANWDFATAHSLGRIFHSFSDLFKTRYRSFVAASSEGKWPLARTARRSLEFRAPCHS